MAFIRKVKTSSGATAVQVVSKTHSRISQVKHIGSAHNPTDLKILLALARSKLHEGQVSLFEPPSNTTVELVSSVSSVLRDVILRQYDCLGFNKLGDSDFAYLCLARIVEPTSKLDSLRVLDDLGVTGIIGEDQLYRCLKRVIAKDYRDQLSELCFACAATRAGGITLVLYDVTTLYFEVQKEDEDTDGNLGYRKPGMSKERRLEPQIIVGLLVDQTGFPLEVQSFEGNKAETKTILPVIEAFKKRHGLIGITVVADAGMLSSNNLEALNAAGYTYIVGSRMNKIPYDIVEYQKTKELMDNQIITAKTSVQGQRIIYQYKQKRAALDLRNIAKQIDKAQKIIGGQAPVKRAKFLSATTKNKQLNQDLIDKAKALAGIKGYVTNLPLSEASNQKVIVYYHQLWHVEQSFRMSKSDLKARPIFHHLKDAIEAHLTIVMASLAIGRVMEKKTGLSVKRMVKVLKPIRSGTVIIAGEEVEAKARIPDTVVPLLRNLERDTN